MGRGEAENLCRKAKKVVSQRNTGPNGSKERRGRQMGKS